MSKIIANNKNVKHNFFIIDSYIAGIVLLGWEIKSIRSNNIDLSNSFCQFKKNELFLINSHFKNYMNVKGDSKRTKKLLLTSHQLNKIKISVEKNKAIIIPLKLFLNNKGWAKLEIVICKPKNKTDKRQAIKEKEVKKYLNKFKI